jgi:hypothetical protein
MKRGIPIALQAAGAVLVCLVTTLNHPAVAHEQTVSIRDTAYYYNEQGEEIFCDPSADSPGSYVIRTAKRKKEIYYDWPRVKKSIERGAFERVKIRCISRVKAKKVEALINKGLVNDPFVQKYTVKILDKNSIRKFRVAIGDSGKNIDTTKDFWEYGAVVNYDTTFTLIIGAKADPHTDGATVELKGEGMSYFHSHPSAENREGDSYFVQGPSLDDAKAVGKKVSYVFGMNKRSHLLYIYNNRGVQATLPFCWFLCN